jgi:uncharacterized membrane protein (UPF0127 family)
MRVHFEPAVLHTPSTTLHLRVACSLCARALGLLAVRSLPLDRGLLIPECRSVHTMGMAYAIDVLFLDGAGCLIEIHPGLSQWRIVWCRRACAVLELAAGAADAAGLKPGDRLLELLPWLVSGPTRRRAG